MGLTRIRAEQISDIDYKQAVRVITLTDIVLTGGAPAEVDGVSLTASNRILVAGQDDAAQNGLYVVQTVGAGSNGTWVRTSDANQDGEIQPGMVVMVTQGTQYADTPWKLITNGEIIIGTTELTFQENYSLAFGNIFANGTAVIANAVSAPITFTAGDNISIIGNNTAKSITIGVTGITTSRIANGTSNVDIATADGNVTTAVNGNTILTITDTGANATGYVTATGNITGNYFIGNGSQLTGIATSAFDLIQVSGQSNVDAATSTTLTFVAGDGIAITTDAGNTTVTFTNTSVESIFATGGDMGLVNQAVIAEEDLGLVTDVFTESYDLGSVVQQFAISGNLAGNLVGNSHSIVDLATLEVLGNISADTITATGNITGDNLSGTLIVGTLTTAAQINITSLGTLTSLAATGNVAGGNINTAGVVQATGNVAGGNLTTTGLVNATGNVSGGNLTTTGLVNATGNITAGNLTPTNALEINYGGTGAIDAANALSNLGAASIGKAIAMTIVFG
jgi:hypothetical protein